MTFSQPWLTPDQIATRMTVFALNTSRHPEVGKHCITELTCLFIQGLIPWGEQPTKQCSRWAARQEVKRGWCAEAG